MTLLSSVLSWYDCMLKCMFIWVNHCLSFFLILLNWSDFPVFSCCCWCCLSSCLMCNCIWIKICIELLDDSATLNAVSLKLLSIIMFFFLKYLFCQSNIYLFDFRWFFLKLDFILKHLCKNCKCCEAVLFLSTDQSCWNILSQDIFNVIEMTQYYFLIRKLIIV